MGHIERKQRDKENVRISILKAALDIAKAESWNSVTIRKIADAIEYTPPIVYEHFQNKEDLIRELILSGFRELKKGIDFLKQANLSPREGLLYLSLNQWEFAFKNKELYQLMFSLERPTPNEEMKSSIALIRELFLQLTNNNDSLSHELLFNWICLQNGIISTVMLMNVPPSLSHVSPFELYKNSIERFLNSI